ncbi:MAG TPA: hypothetical protein VHF22_09940, partial [Planctomycetota bacterium]|nr:hypothetical protein [Planctomycetota bacterium]
MDPKRAGRRRSPAPGRLEALAALAASLSRGGLLGDFVEEALEALMALTGAASGSISSGAGWIFTREAAPGAAA